ncbi:MAG: DUF2894 domain-containing protein [Ketobacteraceae bacterium]|nr:DUF2894 domain-containing protein [Ketobacteraceae bacterium]
MNAVFQILKEDDFAADELIEAIQNRLKALSEEGVEHCCGPERTLVEAMLRRYGERPSRHLLTRLVQAFESLEEKFAQLKTRAVECHEQLMSPGGDQAAKADDLMANGQLHELRHLAIRRGDVAVTPAEQIRNLTEQVQSGELVNPAYSGNLSFDDFLLSQEKEILETVSQESNPEPANELRSIKHFRESWVKLNSEKLLAQAIADAPKEAGPLNSHRLAIQSLTAMRDLSPEYLNRFLSYLETLLWLEKAGESIGGNPGTKSRKGNKTR